MCACYCQSLLGKIKSWAHSIFANGSQFLVHIKTTIINLFCAKWSSSRCLTEIVSQRSVSPGNLEEKQCLLLVVTSTELCTDAITDKCLIQIKQSNSSLLFSGWGVKERPRVMSLTWKLEARGQEATLSAQYQVFAFYALGYDIMHNFLILNLPLVFTMLFSMVHDGSRQKGEMLIDLDVTRK